MRANFTPFLDLFSILAIGLLLVMITTAGTDAPGDGQTGSDGEAVPTGPSPATPVQVWFYLDDSGEAMPAIKIVPYFLMDGVKVDRPDDVIVEHRNDAVVVRFRGGPGAGLSVGFAVAAVRDVDAIGRDVNFTLVRVGGGAPGTQRCISTVGSWREPTVPVGDGAGLSCGGDGAP